MTSSSSPQSAIIDFIEALLAELPGAVAEGALASGGRAIGAVLADVKALAVKAVATAEANQLIVKANMDPPGKNLEDVL